MGYYIFISRILNDYYHYCYTEYYWHGVISIIIELVIIIIELVRILLMYLRFKFLEKF